MKTVIIQTNRKLFGVLFFFGLGVLAASRVVAQGSELGPRVKEQAQKMAAALVAGDYKTFAHYTNPAVKKLAGGDEAFAKGLEQAMQSMKAGGVSIGKSTIGDASPILKYGTELQCTIPQETIVLAKDAKILSKSTLIAISVDGGKNWTFVDTTKKDMAAIRQLLPHLNAGIVVPPTPAPVRVGD